MMEQMRFGADDYPPTQLWAEYLPDETAITTELTVEWPDSFRFEENPDDGKTLVITVANGVARYAIEWDERGFWHAIFLSWHSSLA